jgi:periplasmic divalent cation tolerance protein
MSPYPLEQPGATGPLRIVLSTYPSPSAARRVITAVLGRRLAACANVASVGSRYWWNGHVESAEESLVLFKTDPKRVGALIAFLESSHPYETPEVLEIDVPRVNERYLQYVRSATQRPVPHVPRRATRRGAPRVRGGRALARTRGLRRRRSR